MNKTILNWNGIDHNAIYTGQLREHPLYYDTNLKLWVTYSYEYCKAVLLDSDAHVPQQVIDSNSALNDKATLLLGKMARINNNMQHTVSRSAAMTMFQSITAVAVDQVLEALLSGIKDSFDWVETIGKRLPVQLILKGLGFSEEDAAYITENLESMARIMSPNKTGEDIKLINAVINRFYELAEKYVGTAGLSGDVQETELAICNLIGLFIQSYDAGWGLLCNTLLSLVSQDKNQKNNENEGSYYKQLVNETLRLNPPVHNTRRVAANDIVLGGQTIRAGETILVVLAAANLDPLVFNDPEKFDVSRSNSDQHLTFGLGGHNCLAKYFNVGMATDTCRFLVNNYQNISILQNGLIYEPKLNVRLVKELMVSLS